jgi:hypothetical protein
VLKKLADDGQLPHPLRVRLFGGRFVRVVEKASAQR